MQPIGWKNSRITEIDQKIITEIFTNTPGIKEVVLFGSRALGTAREGSDIDLAVYCLPSFKPFEVIQALSVALNQKSSLPFQFDILAIELITHPELLEHIQKYGCVIWSVQK